MGRREEEIKGITRRDRRGRSRSMNRTKTEEENK